MSEQLSGFVLHRRAYRETSYLTDFFTLELGKVSAVVKGIRGSKGAKKSLLQPFQPLLLTLAGKHELRNLNQLEPSSNMLRLGGFQLFSAMYLNELLNRVLPKEVPHCELFELYNTSLQSLQNGCEIEPCLRQFEIGLLNDLGYGFDLQHEYENGQVVVPNVDYCLVIEQGIKRIGDEPMGSNRFSGAALLEMSNNCWTPASLQCAKRINRMALSHLVGHKPLKSRELFQQMQPTKKVGY